MHQSKTPPTQSRDSDDDSTAQINRKDFLINAGRSVLGLLTIPTVASITGCGPKEEPISVELADVIAQPLKYRDKLITIEAHAKAEEPGVETFSHMTWNSQTKSLQASLATHIRQFHKLYASQDIDGDSLTTYGADYLSGTVSDAFMKRLATRHDGPVIVTGRLSEHEERSGLVLYVTDMREIETPKNN